MKPYEAARKVVTSQLETILACRAGHDPSFDPELPENREELHKMVASEALSMAIGILVRLDVIDDHRNDQAQTSARELVRILSQRLNINVADDLGIPLG